MRARGLKLILQYDFLRPYHVAPHAGAWVETDNQVQPAKIANVAPHAGAWVETYQVGSTHKNQKVAPHAGAWVET